MFRSLASVFALTSMVLLASAAGSPSFRIPADHNKASRERVIRHLEEHNSLVGLEASDLAAAFPSSHPFHRSLQFGTGCLASASSQCCTRVVALISLALSPVCANDIAPLIEAFGSPTVSLSDATYASMCSGCAAVLSPAVEWLPDPSGDMFGCDEYAAIQLAIPPFCMQLPSGVADGTGWCFNDYSRVLQITSDPVTRLPITISAALDVVCDSSCTNVILEEATDLILSNQSYFGTEAYVAWSNLFQALEPFFPALCTDEPGTSDNYCFSTDAAPPATCSVCGRARAAVSVALLEPVTDKTDAQRASFANSTAEVSCGCGELYAGTTCLDVFPTVELLPIECYSSCCESELTAAIAALGCCTDCWMQFNELSLTANQTATLSGTTIADPFTFCPSLSVPDDCFTTSPINGSLRIKNLVHSWVTANNAREETFHAAVKSVIAGNALVPESTIVRQVLLPDSESVVVNYTIQAVSQSVQLSAIEAMEEKLARANPAGLRPSTFQALQDAIDSDPDSANAYKDPSVGLTIVTFSGAGSVAVSALALLASIAATLALW